MTDLKYPLNATGGYDYKGKITFSIGQVEDNVVAIGKWLADQARVTANPNLLDPRNETGTSLSEAEIESFFGGAPPASNPDLTERDTAKGSCVLYLPQGIQFRDGAEYQNLELGAIGASVERAVNSGQNIASAVASAATDELGSLISNITAGNTEAAKLAGARLAAKYGGETIGGGVRSALQVSANPNSRTLFRSVAIRKFTFAFKLVAASEEEAREIKNIIKFFRVNMYPEETAFSSISYAYKFPAPFLIKMTYDSKEVATKLLPAYLEDVSVGYNSTAQAMHNDGSFLETDLQLSFVETRALRRKEIIEKNY